MTTLFAFIVVLGILIFVHEFGHFIIAKLFNVKVVKFSLGFGPAMFGKKLGETEYVISAFPLGGFVKMTGENPQEELDPADEKRAFSHKPVWQRFLIVFAGPASNLIFTFFLLSMVFVVVGLPILGPSSMIGSVSEEGAGAKAGLAVGDVITEINGQQIEDWSEVYHLVTESAGETLAITVQRNSEELTMQASPEKVDVKNEFGEVTGQGYRLGIGRDMNVEFEPATVVQAIGAGFSQTTNMISKTVLGIWKMIQRVIPASEIGGPILIAQIAGQQLQSGWLDFFYFMGFLSVNLGILNLLPIPVLDGGHLTLFSIEAIRRKPMTRELQEKLQMLGLVLLVSLMAFAFYNDIVRMITS
ncbi:MAG: RIP metalloprotease RseP [Desulfobulbaceae bacterium]|nr:MAG: RIP metalloprotease RseP [Desulfobulbaceae bacterium]